MVLQETSAFYDHKQTVFSILHTRIAQPEATFTFVIS